MITYHAHEPRSTGHAIAPGEYAFRVVNAEEKISSNKNEMIELKLEILDDDGNAQGTVYDSLVCTEKSWWKFDHFLKAVGMHPGGDREVTVIPAELIGAGGRCRIANEKSIRDDSIRNTVKGYVWDDEIPF
jgi:hypothetical protein